MEVNFERIMALHETAAMSPAVDVRLPLIRVGNALRQQKLSEMLSELGAWERLNANATAYNEIPATAGLYMFVWAPPLWLRFSDPYRVHGSMHNSCFVTRHVVYIGLAGASPSSGTLRDRYKSEYQHYLKNEKAVEKWFDPDYSPSSRPDRLGRVLSLRPLEYWFLSVQDGSRLIAFERVLQELLNPPGIKQNQVALYPMPARKAF